MQAIILAGGLGTRLRSLTNDWPKSMAPVSGKPFLEYLLVQLKKNLCLNITLCVGYGADLIEEYFGQGHPWGVNLQYSREQELRGTGGALKLAERFIQDQEFLVMNGDSLFDINLSMLIREHQSNKPLITLALAEVEDTQRYGTVEIDKMGNVVQFSERGRGRHAGLINGGIYVFHRQVLTLIREGRPVSLEKEIFPGLVGKGLRGLPFRAYFLDIGIPKDYLGVRADPRQLLAAVS